jgi:tRNA wybutosine-synthesizing protein 3
MNSFQQRKQDVLSKEDKSCIGKWDERIKELCDKINSLDNYYTTSSCSGRIMILKDSDKKGPGLFEFVSHDLVDFETFGKKIKNLKGDFKFKQEPPIIHIACEGLDDAEKLLRMAQETGWKRSGIISLRRNIIIEIIGTRKIEFPLVKNGELLVNEKFLEIIVEKSNENLEKGWKFISKLEKSFS